MNPLTVGGRGVYKKVYYMRSCNILFHFLYTIEPPKFDGEVLTLMFMLFAEWSFGSVEKWSRKSHAIKLKRIEIGMICFFKNPPHCGIQYNEECWENSQRRKESILLAIFRIIRSLPLFEINIPRKLGWTIQMWYNLKKKIQVDGVMSDHWAKGAQKRKTGAIEQKLHKRTLGYYITHSKKFHGDIISIQRDRKIRVHAINQTLSNQFNKMQPQL